MMQQVQSVHDAVACREAPLDGKKNSISRSAEAGESDAWTEYKKTKHYRYFNEFSITFQMPRFLIGIARITFSLPEPNLARRLSGASLLAMAESAGPTRVCHWLTASDPIISKARTGPLVIKPIISLKVRS